MKIIERFERMENEDIVVMGELIEKFFQSDTGELFKVMMNNLQKMEIANSRSNQVTADRYLGRVEAYETVMNDLKAFVERKKEIQRPVNYDSIETMEANEQITTPSMGGEI